MTTHDEEQYLSLIREVLAKGSLRTAERTGVGTLAKFGAQCRYSLYRHATGVPVLPLFTTKLVSFRNVWTELFFFLKAKSHVGWLQERKCSIWNGHSTRTHLDSVGLNDYPVGQLGPVYGAQWRHWGGRYQGACATTGDSLYAQAQPGFDQLQYVIEQLRSNPESRRHVVVSWNPTDLPLMALPPCHALFQFFAETDQQGQKWLSCQMYQRSCDVALGCPYNVASYSLLTHLIAHLTGMKAKEFIHVLGDYHIYLNHRQALEEQCQRSPFCFPTVCIRAGLNSLQELQLDDVILGPYQHHPALKMEMAV